MLFGLHPTENMTVRLGGRAWYLTGPVEGRSSRWCNIADPADTRRTSSASSTTSRLWRYGALAELSYSF